LDLAIISRGAQTKAEAIRALTAALGTHWEVLAHFTATHLGLNDLHVFLLSVNGLIAKLDIAFELASEWSLPTPPQWLAEPPISMSCDLTHQGHIEADELLSLFCGLLWHAHTKIQRGELFEAERTLGFMRTAVIIPTLLEHHGLPREDSRWLESRLPADDCIALRQTYLSSLSPLGLRASLATMVELLRRIHDASPSALLRAPHLQGLLRVWSVVVGQWSEEL
jgi:hypothetical protein